VAGLAHRMVLRSPNLLRYLTITHTRAPLISPARDMLKGPEEFNSQRSSHVWTLSAQLS